MSLWSNLTFTKFIYLFALFSMKKPLNGFQDWEICPPVPKYPGYSLSWRLPRGKWYSWNVYEWAWKMYEFFQKPEFYITHLYRGFPGSSFLPLNKPTNRHIPPYLLTSLFLQFTPLGFFLTIEPCVIYYLLLTHQRAWCTCSIALIHLSCFIYLPLRSHAYFIVLCPWTLIPFYINKLFLLASQPCLSCLR
jgi:hypothetical protein